MDGVPRSFSIELPQWVDGALGQHVPDVESRMRLVLDLTRRHISELSGGPFGAAVFESVSGRLVSVGLNVVVPSAVPVAHAEIVAIALAGVAAGTFDLGAEGRPDLEIVASSEPCAMCFGAIPWSGMRRLVCGARDEDARAVGFDEGAKPADWVSALEHRGIEVIRDVMREDGAALLAGYAAAGGLIYNGRRDA